MSIEKLIPEQIKTNEHSTKIGISLIIGAIAFTINPLTAILSIPELTRQIILTIKHQNQVKEIFDENKISEIPIETVVDFIKITSPTNPREQLMFEELLQRSRNLRS